MRTSLALFALPSLGSAFPRIDLFPVLHPSNGSYAKELKKCGKEVAAALDQYGAFIVYNTDIHPVLQDELYRSAREYFHQKKEDKMKIPITSDNSHGYETHRTASGENEESFTVMVGHADEKQAETVWPQTPGDFGAVWENYYRRTEFTSDEILKCIAYALGVSQNFFLNKSKQHRSLLRGIHHISVTREHRSGGVNGTVRKVDSIPIGTIRAGAERHHGLLTLLKQPHNSGLELQGFSGTWTPVTSTEEELVVNVGELMSYWTGGRWKPVAHRVVETGEKLPRDGLGRLSFAYYHHLDPKARVNCKDLVGSTCSNPPVVADDWVKKRHQAAIPRVRSQPEVKSEL